MAEGDKRFMDLLGELARMHVAKSTDYGRNADPIANLRASEEFGVPAWKGTLLRLNDKVHRLKSFALNGSLANEGFEDSLLDLASYSLLALILYRETVPAAHVPPPDEVSASPHRHLDPNYDQR